MSYVVRIHTLAAADTVEAALWYDAQVSGLGAEFLAEVDAVVERLAISPEIYAIRFADVRRAPVQVFWAFLLYSRNGGLGDGSVSWEPPSQVAKR